jgi:Glycosyl hydrolase family 99
VRSLRLLSASCVVSAALLNACGAQAPADSEVSSVSQGVSITKTYTRKIYVHMMPWFQVGGTHWSMNSRNSATGVASWFKPMIGEYSSNDGNVIEYQLLTMKYAGIDGVIIDWPGLNGANDLPQNKINSDTIIGRTAEFGMEFGICYEDQDAVSIDAAKNDMSYVQSNFFNKPNYMKIANAPALLVFGPSKYGASMNVTSPDADWANILSVFSTKPTFFSLWYNPKAGSNAQGQFGWPDQKGLDSLTHFDDGTDGGGHGIQIPVLFPGFNSYYAAGGWPGPTWKISYTLKQDNTEGGNTLASAFALGKFSGQALQIATWNDYGEGTMVEPTDQLQYQSLTTLQTAVGTSYTDAELKIVKMLFDQRRATNGSQAAKLNMASQALANLDLTTACSILGCTVPVHTTGGGAGGASGSAGAKGSAGAPAAGGSTAAGGTKGTAGAPAAGGSTGTATGGHAGSAAAAGGKPGSGGGSTVATGGAANAAGDDGESTGKSGCSVSLPGRSRPSALLFGAAALAVASLKRRRRARSVVG